MMYTHTFEVEPGANGLALVVWEVNTQTKMERLAAMVTLSEGEALALLNELEHALEQWHVLADHRFYGPDRDA